jgi:hypothetical protein
MPAAQRLERVADFHGSLPDRGKRAAFLKVAGS